MKNLSFLPLFLLLATALFAQQKTEFGLALNAGNFTLPAKGPGPQPSGFTHSANHLSAGFSTGLGVYKKINIRSNWGLIAEVRYTFAAYALHEQFNFDPQYEQYLLFEHDWTRHYTEQNLVLPLKMYFDCGRTGKTSVGIGVAPAFHLQTKQQITHRLPELESQLAQYEVARAYYHLYQNSAKPAPKVQVLFVASLHRQIGARASLGVELMAAPYHNELDVHFSDYKDKSSAQRSPFSMKSLSVSLQYRLLH